MPKESEVWNYFTRLPDHKAMCKDCAKEFNTKGGTTNMWRHLLKHHTHPGHEKGTLLCNKCQSKMEGKIASRVEHVVACNNLGAPAEGASRQPPVQTTRAPPDAGSSPMDLEPADLGAQPPLLPSDPSRPGGSSSMDPEPAGMRVQPLPSGPSGSDGEEPGMEEAKNHLAKIIALSGYDPSIVDDDYFRSFVKCLNPKFEVPSSEYIGTKCKGIFWRAMSDSLYTFYDSEGATASFAVGKAKVIEKEVIYLAYHFIDSEWNLHEVIRKAAISSVWPETTADIGLNMVSTVAEAGDEYRLFTVAWGVTDDHSKLKGFLNQYLPHAGAPKRKVFCTTFVDCILHSVADHLYRNIDAEFSRDISISASFVDFQEEQLEVLSRVGRDLWAYKEAWYSWYCFLLIDSDGHEGATLDIRDLLLKIFGEIFRAIQKFCAFSGPMANLCLVELINVRKFLQNEIATARTRGGYTNLYEGHSGFADNKDVATVLTELTEILEESIKEWYLIWSIPLILDPRYNLNRVTSIFREAFVDEAAHYVTKLLPNIIELYSEYVNQKCEHEWQRQAAQAELDDYLAQAELDDYLTFCVVPPTEDFDILDWWKVQGSHHYPTVARMARDALAIPTCNQLSSKQTAQLKGRLRGYWL